MNFFNRKPAVEADKPKSPEEMEASNAAEYFTRGMAFYAHGQFEKALSDFDMAGSLDPASVDAAYGKGLVYRAQAEVEKARQAFQQAITLLEAGDQTNLDRVTMLKAIARAQIEGLKAIQK